MQSHQSFETIQMFSLSIYIFCGNVLFQFALNHAFIFYFFAWNSARWKRTISASTPTKAHTQIIVHALTANLSPSQTGFFKFCFDILPSHVFSNKSVSLSLLLNILWRVRLVTRRIIYGFDLMPDLLVIRHNIVQRQFVFQQTVQHMYLYHTAEPDQELSDTQNLAYTKIVVLADSINQLSQDEFKDWVSCLGRAIVIPSPILTAFCCCSH
jgi:hypothetical protein